MKLQSFFVVGVLGCLFFYIFPREVLAASSDIILSEFQIESINKEGKTDSKDEFVELYNTTDQPLSLKNYKLVRKTSTGTVSSLRSSFKTTDTIPGKGFYLLVHKDAPSDLLAIKDNEFVSSGTLATNNSLALLNEADAPLDSIAWGTGGIFNEETRVVENILPNHSLTRERETLSWSITNTPSPTNSLGAARIPPVPEPVPDPIPDPIPDPLPPPASSPVTVRLNEILPDPSAKGDAGEFIELYNFGTGPADISGWEILDATAMKKQSDGKTLSKSDRLVFPEATVIPASGYALATDRDSWFSLTLNNTNETLSLFHKNGALVDSLHFDKTKENISLNYTGAGWRGGTPTPGAENRLNSLPETKEKIPKKGYRGVPVVFDARGKDTDRGKLKYTWNFGDNHKSYKEKTSHTYEETGIYLVTLTTTDGSDDITETFSLEITSLPKPNVRITAMIPNPSGKDSDAEWLMIENRGKKSVDLKGFGIATGWKKLVNHPVRESFVIAPKGEAKLTREFSLFTLPNEKGKIELRAPDGDVLQKIKYKLDKSVAEDVVYKKENGKRWAWQEQVATASIDSVNTPDAEESVADTVIAPLPAPEEESVEEKKEEQELSVPQEAEKLSLLPLLNYGTHITLPENIKLTFDDPSLVAAPVKKEHYALTFAKEVMSDLNTTLNAVQNGE